MNPDKKRMIDHDGKYAGEMFFADVASCLCCITFSLFDFPSASFRVNPRQKKRIPDSPNWSTLAREAGDRFSEAHGRGDEAAPQAR